LKIPPTTRTVAEIQGKTYAAFKLQPLHLIIYFIGATRFYGGNND